MATSLPAHLCADEPDKPSKAPHVRLVVDYSDGVEKHFTAISWKKGMTVLAALEAAQAHRRGIRFEFRGQKETVFVTRIDDLANEGSGRNWEYRVNDQLATKSCGIYELAPGDTVLWKFKSSR